MSPSQLPPALSKVRADSSGRERIPPQISLHSLVSLSRIEEEEEEVIEEEETQPLLPSPRRTRGERRRGRSEGEMERERRGREEVEKGGGREEEGRRTQYGLRQARGRSRQYWAEAVSRG